jgi:hypothetical protein
MHADQIVDDGEAEPEAAMRARRAAVGLAEPLEDVRRKSASMPQPLSATISSRKPGSAALTVTSTWPPPGVKRTAFDNRFQMICCSRRASARVVFTAGSSCFLSVTFFASAAGRTDSSAASIAGAISTSAMFSRTRPVAMRDTSSSSSTICDCTRALRSMTFTAWLTRARS